MEHITQFIINNSDIIAPVRGFLLVHFSASIITVITKTKSTKLYKLIEALALVWGKAKDKK